ncbi:methyl-accepting chemotaxis protein [Couchioplanes azureus]|uniref:methyl-accepting chemotaxis protein n=1 Tax=Couchioplanes caeruleus TaxID=56438 RepID=UPI00166FEA7E|nr:methyl-accepting chemotaxis protein [Couchioplanes caeruleus]GGQ72960.1 hypothetical protein GCM10010166_48690 [Couchioplanes caeruleus subsp. azureus]
MSMPLSKLPAKRMGAICVALYLIAYGVLVGVVRPGLAEAAAALPAGSPARESAELAASALWWVWVLVLPAAIYVHLASMKSIMMSLGKASKAIIQAEKGDLTARIHVPGADEMAQMAAAYNVMMERVAETVRGMRETAEELNRSAAELNRASGTMTSTVDATAEQLDAVAGSVGRTTEDISEIAAGTGQMREAITEISTNTSAVTQAAHGAVERAGIAVANVERLRDSGREIGEVIRSVQAIAAQTNLLALNATIEAARAGEAGRGFAIVAGEVKDLAQATAEATEEITRRIETIQQETDGAVHAVGDITDVIQAIADYQHTIASAVEEQTATTATMAASAGVATGSAEVIVSALETVRGVAGEARGASAATRQAAEELAAMSDRLTKLAASFH